MAYCNLLRAKYPMLPLQLLAWASLSFIPMALLLLLMVFTSLDPVEARQWACTDPADLQCAAVLAGSGSGGAVGLAYCALGPGRARWTHPGFSIISDFDLTCGDAWKVCMSAEQTLSMHQAAQLRCCE